VLLGTFAVLYALRLLDQHHDLVRAGARNGLLVDDAIVVVENVERLMDENPEMTPARGDDRVDGANPDGAGGYRAGSVGRVPADGVFGGSTGVIYRQFSATIVSAMALSVFVALTPESRDRRHLLKRNVRRSRRAGSGARYRPSPI
jgi:multidrug efflux pump